MNRKERRTLIGRVKVAEAKVAALEAKLRAMEMHQKATRQEGASSEQQKADPAQVTIGGRYQYVKDQQQKAGGE